MHRFALAAAGLALLAGCANYEVVSGNADEITYKFDPGQTKMSTIASAAAEHCAYAQLGDSHAYAVDDDRDGNLRIVRFVCRPEPDATLKQILNQ